MLAEHTCVALPPLFKARYRAQTHHSECWTLTLLCAPARAVNCILRWAAHREHPTCPQCKQPFEHLFTYRRLDGGLHDFPQEESVTLLKRACWFTNYMLVRAVGFWSVGLLH